MLKPGAAAGAVLLAAALTATRGTTQPSAGQDGVVAAGRLVYERECAGCHGRSGSGLGPAASVLRAAPPDLTRYSSRTVPFPRDAIRRVITGRVRQVPPHWRNQMPVWRTSLDEPIPGSVTSRLDALLAYLEEIQGQPYGSDIITPQILAETGRTLFESHCASCHGRDGRGNATGPASAPVDLTTIAVRNGGAFELRRVYEYIAGLNDGSHDRTMPAFARSLYASAWPPAVTMRDTEALANFIESIQRRPSGRDPKQ